MMAQIRSDHTTITEKSCDMMTGYDMGYGELWLWVVLVLAVLAIAALVKYLRK